MEKLTEDELKRLELNDSLIGLKIVEFLNLELTIEGRVKTDWGTKTPSGLARTIKRLIREVENGSN